MPYKKTLHRFMEAEWFDEPPKEWITRLREISPVTDRLAHLRFRCRRPREHFADPRRAVWEVYACTPSHLIPAHEALKYQRHWSELPVEFQPGRQATVSNYQHYMWHQHRVEVRRFWVLQAPREGEPMANCGGTPAKYTAMEVNLLKAVGAMSEEFPIGFFEPCPFDERAVRAVMLRDRFRQALHSVEGLQKMDSVEAQKEQDRLAAEAKRKAFLSYWNDAMAPNAEFLKSYLRTSEADNTLRRATKQEANAMSDWKDTFIHTGVVPGASIASSKAVSVPVLRSIQ